MEIVVPSENVDQFVETVRHLWNVNQFMTKIKSPLTTELQTFYMQKCKNLSNVVQLPRQNFGPSVMCSYCGSLWSTVDHQVRIASGRKMSRSMRKITKLMSENPNREIPKICAALAQRSMKNEMNKLVIKCSVCSKTTMLPFKKQNRLKAVELNEPRLEISQSKRKKKKKSKDKTAGLNISGTLVSRSSEKNNSKTGTGSPLTTPKIISNRKVSTSKGIFSNKNTSTPKGIFSNENLSTPKGIFGNKNLCTSAKKSTKKLKNVKRLKNILENSTQKSTKSNLLSFLTELY